MSPLLSSRALEVSLRLFQEDAMSYDRLKLVSLKRCDFTEFGYRKRFREAKPVGQESPGPVSGATKELLLQVGGAVKSGEAVCRCGRVDGARAVY